MPLSETTRHNLPFLAVSQAQKEITHNEALIRIDALLHPVVQAQQSAPPVLTDADIGKCWLIAATPTGDWAGKSGQIAVWIGGGWRFCAAVEGMRLRLQSSGSNLYRSGGNWITAPAISNPANGAFIDAEVRIVLVALLQHLRAIGLVTN